jgi:hypothetical protein
MPLIRVVTATLVLLLAVSALAQAPTDDLVAADIQIVNGVGDFGQPVVQAVGTLNNASAASAYTGIRLDAKVYDAQDALVGEGIGVLVNACGIGLLPGYTLQPGESQAFVAPLELAEADASVARVEIAAEAQPADPAPAPALAEGITQVTDAESVNVEWIDPASFRYSTGCETDLFSRWSWFSYDVDAAESTPITPPHAEDANDTMRQRLELGDDAVFAHSMMRFAPDDSGRVVYQNERNDFLTAYRDGTFRRGLYNDLNNRTLRGIYWQPNGRFLAYYYGAYGDPVYYFAADAEARVISPPLAQNPPSVTAPGYSRDGRRVVVTGDYDQGRGYYLYVATNGFFELQFLAEPPGNNYPAPIPLATPDSDPITRIYVALPVDGQARLQCYNRDENTLHDLAPLPLELANDERAWWWLSPDNAYIALAADGTHGGLWLIDLAALPACEGGAPAATATAEAAS